MILTRPVICSVEGCENKVEARALCSKHLTREKRYGSPNLVRCRACGSVDPEEGMVFSGRNHVRCQECAKKKRGAIPRKPSSPARKRDERGRLVCATEGCEYPVGLHSERDGFKVCQQCYWKEVRAGRTDGPKTVTRASPRS